MTRPFDDRRILLGVTGGIAAYKSALISSLLTQAGAAVDVVLRLSEFYLIGAISLEALNGWGVQTSMIAEDGRALNIAVVPVPESWLKKTYPTKLK